jgi:hypothetical protein
MCGKIKKNIKTAINKSVKLGIKNSMGLSNMFRDTLEAPFYNNTDGDLIHREPYPLV